jgi:IS1 family transposase
MNRLSIADRAKILGMLVEGNSLRSSARMAEVSVNTVTKLLMDLGGAGEKFHDEHVRNVSVRRLQCDEIWCFVGAKAKNVTPEQKAQGWGDTWTWTGLCADTKLCVGYLVGGRDADWAMEFMLDCADRIKGRVQVTTDGHKAYLEALETAFGADCDYAMLQKIYGAPSDEESRHYSTARCIGCDLKVVSGETDPKHASTSYVERLNLTMGMSMRRRTRLTNAFSKRIQNHAAMVAIHAVHYNFARIHKTLRSTPAMAAGLSDHVWRLEEIVMMADCYAPKPSKRGPYKKRNAD